MIKRMFVAFGIVLFALSTAGINAVNAAPQAVDLSKPEEVQRVIKRVVSDVNVMSIEPEYGAVKFDKKNNKLIVSDITLKYPGEVLKYKKLVISNYNEDSEAGSYTCEEVTFTDGMETSDEAVWENFAVSGKGNIMEFDYETYKRVSVSNRDKELTIDLIKIKGFRVHLPNGNKSQPITLEAHKHRITKLDKAKHDVFQLMKESSKKEKDISGKVIPGTLISFLNKVSSELITIANVPEIPVPGSGALRLGEISFKNWRNGQLGEVAVENIEVLPSGIATETMKLKRISVRDIKLLEVVKFGETMILNPFEDSIYSEVSKISSMFSGISIEGLSTKSPEGNISANLNLNWGKFVGLFPTEITLDGISAISPLSEKIVNPDSPDVAIQKQIIEVLKQAGIDKLSLKTEIKIAWDEKAQKITITPMVFDMDNLFSLSFTASLGNIPRSTLEETDPQKLGLLFMGATAGPITLEIKDKGVQVIYEKMAKGSLEGLGAAVSQDSQSQAVYANVLKLVNSPKGTIKITMKPKGNVGIAQLAGALAVSPEAIPALFDISSEYSK